VGIILSVSYTAKRKDEPTEKKTTAKMALATA
jgi:hypothetical protein